MDTKTSYKLLISDFKLRTECLVEVYMSSGISLGYRLDNFDKSAFDKNIFYEKDA